MITGIGDLVLIHHQGMAKTYARVEDITADVKPGWWRVRLMVLVPPPQEMTWILREEYIDGGEFTMSGETMRLEPVPPPRPTLPEDESEPDQPEASPGRDSREETKGRGESEKVVNLFDRKPKNNGGKKD